MKEAIRYYAVKRGRWNGIFHSLAECKKHVDGFEDALYETFNSCEKALKYLGIKNESYQEIAKLEIAQTEYFSSKREVMNAYVDGSFKENDYSGAFIIIENNCLVYERSRKGMNNKAAKTMGSNVGELNATMLAIQHAINQGAKKILIYHDNSRIRQLITEKKEPRNDFEREYVDFVYQCKEEGELKVDFIKVKAHNGGRNKWNEYVDDLASETRINDFEIKRDVKQIKEQIKTIHWNIEKFDKSQKNRFHQIKKDIRRLQCITHSEEIFIKKLFEESQKENDVELIFEQPKEGEYVENSFKYTYNLYKKGLTFEEIAKERNIVEPTIAYHLMLCKMRGYQIKLDDYIPKANHFRKDSDEEIIDCVNKGFSVEKMIKKLKQKKKNIIKKIILSFKNGEIASIDQIFSKEKQNVIDNKKIESIEITNKCFNYFKENKEYMSESETNKAYVVYRKAKENKVIEKERIEIVTIAKLVKRRSDIFNSYESSYVKSYLLIETGLSVNDVANMRGLQPRTIMIHLIQSYREGKNIMITNYLTNPSYYELILEKIKALRTNDIRVLKANLPDYVSYEDIKIVMAVSECTLIA